MNRIPQELDKCVDKLKAQGKSEKAAFAICTASLRKSGKLEEDLASIEEDSFDFEELEAYLQENALLAWSAPTKRKDIPASHFFDPKNKKYPYRNADGSVNCSGVMAAWKMANGARSGKKASSSIIAKIRPYRDRCMKTDSSKKQQDAIRKFFTVIPELTESSVQLSEKGKPAKFQVLRYGKFKHPWWGILKFDDAFFNSLVENFEAGIPQSGIAFDFKHNPDWGAAAWIKSLSVEKEGLFATVDLTEKGKQSLKDREFKFFSIEYTDNYTEYQFQEEKDETGKTVEKEISISHGPTVLGGGLTNRPFIKGMKPVSLSDPLDQGEPQTLELEEIEEKESFNIFEEVNVQMKKTLEELKAEQATLTEKIDNLSKKADEESKKELSEINVQLEGIVDSIKELSEKQETTEKSTEAKALEETEAAKKALEEKLSVKDKEIKKLSDDFKTLSETVKSLMESNRVLQEDKYRIVVEKKLEEFKKLGAFPSTLKVIQPILLSEEAKSFSVSLSEEGKEVKKPLISVFEDVLNSIPKEYRFSEDERTESTINSPGEKELSVDDVEKYAKEKNITFEEALVQLSKEGKIL